MLGRILRISFVVFDRVSQSGTRRSHRCNSLAFGVEPVQGKERASWLPIPRSIPTRKACMHISMAETAPHIFPGDSTAVRTFNCSWLLFVSHYVHDQAFAMALKRESFRSFTPSVWRAYAVMTFGSLGKSFPAYSSCRRSRTPRITERVMRFFCTWYLQTPISLSILQARASPLCRKAKRQRHKTPRICEQGCSNDQHARLSPRVRVRP